VAGLLEDSNNVAISNAELVLIAQPTQAQTDSAATSMTPLSRGYTDGSGDFTLTTPDPSTLSQYADPSGEIDFIVIAPGTAATPFYFSRLLTHVASQWFLHDGGWGPIGGIPGTPQTLADDGDDSFDAPVDATIGGSGSDQETGEGFDAATYPEDGTPDSTTGSVGGVGTCTKSKPLKIYRNRPAIVGQFFSTLGTASTWTNTKAGSAIYSDFEYSAGAKSTIGVAISPTGEVGSFTQSGTKSRASTATMGFARDYNDGGWYHQTYFDAARYLNTCPVMQAWYSVEPYQWDGGEPPHPVTGASPPSGVSACVNFNAGDYWDRTDTRAITWTNGFGLGSIIGLDVSVRTGYNTDADLSIHYNTRGRLCGREKPGVTPYVLVAHKPS
jgi:hypothetical protein